MLAVACSRNTLVGRDRNTGPHGGVDANFMPRRTVAGIDAVVSACQNHLVIGPVIVSEWSESWNWSPPRLSCSTAATATSSGIWSFQLLIIWVMALGRPMLATITTPVFPEARAYPSAMAMTAPS